MTDDEMIAEVIALKPVARAMIFSAGQGENIAGIRLFKNNLDPKNPILDVDRVDILKAAWGPRRVSGRTRGMTISAYPSSVMATQRVWVEWIDREVKHVGIIIAKKKAQARIDAALKNSSTMRDPEMIESEPSGAITEEEIKDMLDERKSLRAERRFAEADMIRDYLIRHGVSVSDASVRG